MTAVKAEKGITLKRNRNDVTRVNSISYAERVTQVMLNEKQNRRTTSYNRVKTGFDYCFVFIMIVETGESTVNNKTKSKTFNYFVMEQ